MLTSGHTALNVPTVQHTNSLGKREAILERNWKCKSKQGSDFRKSPRNEPFQRIRSRLGIARKNLSSIQKIEKANKSASDVTKTWQAFKH